ncbi:alpha/beta fold hydrolase [Stigmatella sp. ncwal1]|uniref:Alpha/beta fold hydrolase n=1 Tax=Stigmatella ashevillensis TaxID=2995309 RepID=A0ABT5D7X8_9BACT|nr:alpha/beta fold hydrolase [Stigmatella ashevillena]MDC0709744.1 alpha/beta fold hydrolase [Stigmatella ashevillena]
MDLMGGVQKMTRQMLVARGVRSTVRTVGGQSVHSYELKGQGKGPPVVLVHGLGGSANGFSRVMFPLGRRFSRVLALDLPGHGFSTEFCAGPGCVRGQFDTLRAWVEQTVGEPAFVVGNSLGGAMVVNLAAEASGLVRALGLVAPAGAALSQETFDALLSSFAVETAEEARSLTRRLFHKAPLPLLLLSSEMRKFYATPAVQALTEDARTTRASLTPEALQSLSMPVLLLWGGSERLLPSETLDYFRAHLPPHAQVQVVKGFGHVPQMERPDELVARLVAFADKAGL